ncbi:Hexokinase-1 [Cyphellophora attinorum]|uniref:Phosphotransferase n=1 Tax=Cyphellophora attinorum TaxID=1664694 RepID=A0A0N0NN59_9EURO|nr:Hexokinase-1 [Phialophora attinorum]KPI41241.1 Hexokinase-1 [Phialophora attinorum]
MSMLIYPTAAKALPPTLSYADVERKRSFKPLQTFADEVDRVFRYPCSIRRMLKMSAAMKDQFREKLQKSDACMLPSYCRSAGSDGMIIHHMTSNKIDEPIRRLRGTLFFEWMAAKIQAMLAECLEARPKDQVIALGLTWSFPLEQTSYRTGKIQAMGKGFQCAHDNLGADLAALLENACTTLGLAVRVEAIINDGAATLLSQAYLEPTTSMGLILGTGTNAAAFLPTLSMGRSKFGLRSPSWFTRAEKVIVNTESSMFGGGILPRSNWDEVLNRNHALPDFQPLEYMTTGRYLGELMRLIVLDAVQSCNMFGGTIPAELLEPYSLDTAILAQIEEDQSSDMKDTSVLLVQAFGLLDPPSRSSSHSYVWWPTRYPGEHQLTWQSRFMLCGAYKRKLRSHRNRPLRQRKHQLLATAV